MGEVAAITIDVDSLRHYLSIHGLRAPPPEQDPIYTIAMPRFFALLEELGLPATLFVIGGDIGPHHAAFGPAQGLGCEIASHSFGHEYGFFENSAPVIDAELQRAEAALLPLSAGQKIVGFRAPGYNTSPALLSTLLKRGYLYDSSLLPSPAYWAARGAAITRYQFAGRPSASRVGQIRAFAGPLEPYRTSPNKYWRAQPDGPLLEFPMACVPKVRIPLIGTSWVLFPDLVRWKLLNLGLCGLKQFNFEMHAIDLLDASDPGVPQALVDVQPDLRVPVTAKMHAFRSLFRRLADDRTVETLRKIALDSRRM